MIHRSVIIFAVVLFCVCSAGETTTLAQPPGGPGGQGPGGPGGRGGRGGPGGFPSPPVLDAIDADGDGEISAEEMANAAKALAELDKNKDSELSGDELVPEFFRGGRGGRGGGRGGRGGGRGGRGGEVIGKRIEPEDLDFKDGVASIPDHATYHKLSYRGEQVMIDTFLSNLEFVKFTFNKPNTDEERLYFINTTTHRAHHMFGQAAGLPRGRGDEQMKGVLVYRPMLKSPSGKQGLYTYEFEPFDEYRFEMVQLAREALIEKMPILKGNLGYFPRGERAMAKVNADRAKYKAANLPIYLNKDLTSADVAYLPLNAGTSFGRLRIMEINQIPNARDVVIYKTIPNELPRTSGIITAVRQTPLSHVNLRAVQDRVPNSFISGILEDENVKSLVGEFVAYSVTADGYELRKATESEVDGHLAKLRPATPQSPERDLSITDILPLEKVEFTHADVVGVKATNLATMRTFGMDDEIIPNGFAVPFYFYDEFMKHNELYDRAKELIENDSVKKDPEELTRQLAIMRAMIKNGKMPEWMMSKFDELHKSFAAGTALRCRSSTNNEDLPGFSGAGLYDSCTHRPDEGHLSKSIMQVYASLWNFRAFEEREFYRVDHLTTAMAVLVHPNYDGERANGVAVTTDILYQTQGNYYLNTQVGEDLVTNPEEASIPEEGLLDWWDSKKYQVMRSSNRIDKSEAAKSNQSTESNSGQILSAKHLEQMKDCLAKVHGKFAKLYETTAEDERFAMEVEFKITEDDKLVIKQARPWVFADEPKE